ncbi:MAG: GAF domain-containing protein [Paenibacillaceae bacterium]
MDEDLQLNAHLELLIKQISSDLSAIALIDQNNKIRWRYMFGNMNERYRHMVTKPGLGISGQVIRFGRTVIIDQIHSSTELARGQFPIMLAEQLLAAIAVPLLNNNRIVGVLLVGDREKRLYNMEDIHHVEKARERILAIMPREHIQIK